MTEKNGTMSREVFEVLVRDAMQQKDSRVRGHAQRLLMAEIPGIHDFHYGESGGPIKDQESRLLILYVEDTRRERCDPQWLDELYAVMTEDHRQDEADFQRSAHVTVPLVEWMQLKKEAQDLSVLSNELEQRLNNGLEVRMDEFSDLSFKCSQLSLKLDHFQPEMKGAIPQVKKYPQDFFDLVEAKLVQSGDLIAWGGIGKKHYAGLVVEEVDVNDEMRTVAITVVVPVGVPMSNSHNRAIEVEWNEDGSSHITAQFSYVCSQLLLVKVGGAKSDD